MIKRIITFVLCLALCISCVAIGVINQKANDADVAAGAIGGAGNGTVDKISASIPEDAAKVGDTELYQLGNVYYLNSDIDLVEGTNVSTYDKLVALIDNKANGTTAVTIDGLGHTITTNRPLFTTIANVTIKNLIADGSVETKVYPSGVIANAAVAPFTANNVTNNADITYNAAATKGVPVGGLFGSITNGALLENCVNNGDVTIDADVAAGIIGGILGQHTGTLMTFRNCVNNGTIKAETATKFNWAGGIVGQAAVTWTVIENVLNTGDVSAECSVVQNLNCIGGIVGHNQALKISDAINLGNVSLIYSGTADVTSTFSLTVGGIVGRGHHTTEFKRCINAGNLSFTASAKDFANNKCRNALGGISPWYYGGNSKFIDCIDIGTCSSTERDNMGSISPHISADKAALLNCYAFSFPNHNSVTGFFNATNLERYFITLPENIGTLLTTIREKQITDGAAIFSAILAVSEYDADFAHNNDDGMFLSSFDGFTVTADAERNDYFTTVLNKEYLENVKTILGVETVKFGAIIAPATYVTKIGAFSHDAFDTYYTNNADAIDAKVAENGHDPITALYVTARFGDGADFTDVDGVYNAGIYLSGAYDTAYAAKMYIQIGEGETANYVYSK